MVFNLLRIIIININTVNLMLFLGEFFILQINP